jgi:1,4-alpha-glucan branching enzyme
LFIVGGVILAIIAAMSVVGQDATGPGDAKPGASEPDASEIDAIRRGRHRDAFRVLGPHESGGGWVVRAWLPHATAASIVAGSDVTPMELVHPSGFFVAKFAHRPGEYRFRAALYSGEQHEFDDPYRFPPLLTAFELHLHGEGTNYESYRTLGAHAVNCEDVDGIRFAVWAPNAEVVSVVGDFNHWDRTRHPMRLRDGGIWEIFLPGLGPGACYKYSVVSRSGSEQQKSDPYGFLAELPPKTASVTWKLDNYAWGDGEWMAGRAARQWLREPISIYEVHLASWMRGPANEWLTYRELAHRLVEYAGRMGYTHLELLPVMEHPFSGSWGYQVTGYYAPTSRFGTPEDFRYFVDRCHQAGIGVILDWVPGHFPRDAHALWRFDGTALYEHEDPRQGEHREWGTMVFNYGRNEVRTFLLSNAIYWLREFHVDGLRVDAVASMLYLDYSREPGEWLPNRYGGRENLEALGFIRRFNELVHLEPGAVTIAEESTSWPGVSRPVYLNGLGFTMKWNMGWMHDMFDYFANDPVFRRFHQQNITFSMLYAFTENFVLPVSHDEVVHMKRALVSKMPGDEWQRFANARAFLGYMFAHPGKKLLFMGCDIGQTGEWNHDEGLPWHLLQYPIHAGMQTLVRELNALYRREQALYEVDDDYSGFEWIDFRDSEASVISFGRFARDRRNFLVFCCNFTPVPRHFYRIGVPAAGVYREILNTDAAMFGGSNMGNGGAATAEKVESHGRPFSLRLTLPPLAVIAFKL